jgi:hypothetical protein
MEYTIKVQVEIVVKGCKNETEAACETLHYASPENIEVAGVSDLEIRALQPFKEEYEDAYAVVVKHNILARIRQGLREGIGEVEEGAKDMIKSLRQ